MSEKPDDPSLRAFALQHAASLAEPIEKLCGQVIAKGITGILETVCELRQQQADLLEAAQEALLFLDHMNGPTEKLRAAIAKAGGAPQRSVGSGA